MKKVALLLAAGAMMVVSGCSGLSTNVQSSNIGTSTSANFQADLHVGEKISGTCSITKILFFTVGDTDKEASGVMFDAPNASASQGSLGPVFSLFASADPVSKCARAAAYNAVVKNGADIIFAPRYTSEVSGIPFLFQTINVNLTGYKATIKGFKQLDSQKIQESRR